MERLELPNILSLAQSLRGDDIYGKAGKYPQIMSNFNLTERVKYGRISLSMKQ